MGSSHKIDSNLTICSSQSKESYLLTQLQVPLSFDPDEVLDRVVFNFVFI